MILLLLLLFATVPILQKEIFAQEVIGNEIISNNNNKENPDNLNEFLPKPQVHVSIEGTEKPDKLRGGDGNDVISGEDGEDTLQGNKGDDDIDGGDGDDVIDGGIGDDELRGGKGADRFICDRGDKIIDFNSLENDKIIGSCEYEDEAFDYPSLFP
jgi:Ca2+-binding RTX toxin-like protein